MSIFQLPRAAKVAASLLPALVAVLALGCGDEPSSNTNTCSANETSCSGACVDTNSDAKNCGACGTACTADQTCSNGACVLDCVTGQTACDGTCVNTRNDIANCGACGTACAAGEVCSNSACALSCQASLTDCNGTCVDTTSDLANCGACGMACAAGDVCSNSACALSCQADLTDCSGICVNTMTDLAHCGVCGIACAAGEVCSNGVCALSCQSGLENCNGLCVDVKINAAHCGACGTACATDAVCDAGTCVSTTPVDLQFLSISDWHAQIDPVTVNNVAIGGASVLSTYFKQERMSNPNTVTVTSGDAFGASPPLAAFFNEVPAVKALNMMGLQFDTFGNHNFDQKVMHLQSMIDLATYKYVSANLNNLSTNLMNVASPYYIQNISGVPVAFIGLTNASASSIFPTPDYLGTMTIADPIVSAKAARDAAAAAGAKVFVALYHEGATYCTQPNNCTGPLIDFAQGVTGFNIIFGDHTDIEYNKVINGAHVIQNRSKGLTYARVNLSVIPWTGVVTKSSATLVQPISSAVTPDAAIDTMLVDYRMQLSAQYDVGLATATDIFPRGNNVERLGEVALGNLVTDAMRAKYGTQLAMINGGGLRAPIPSSYAPANTMLRRTSPGYAAGPPYDIVVGDAYAVLPFGNIIVTRTVTGTQLWSAMETSVMALPAANGRFAQISGFRFKYDVNAPVGMRVVQMSLSDGTPIPKDQTTYTMALSNFINAGGDGYTIFADGQGTTRDVDATVLADYMKMLGVLNPTIEGRILPFP